MIFFRLNSHIITPRNPVYRSISVFKGLASDLWFCFDLMWFGMNKKVQTGL